MAESYRPPGIIGKYVTYGGIISPEYIYIYMQCYIAYTVKGYHIINIRYMEILLLLLLYLSLLLFVITSCSLFTIIYLKHNRI